VLDLLLAHVDARAATVGIGKIGDPVTDPDAATHVVDPEPSIDSQKNTALVPSLSQFARISEPRIASDQNKNPG